MGADARARPQDLRYVYEGSPDFAALPSFAIIPAQAGLNQLMAGVDGLDFNLMSLLHGEQYLELLRPLPTSATLRSKPYIVDVLDKGKGALIIMNGKCSCVFERCCAPLRAGWRLTQTVTSFQWIAQTPQTDNWYAETSFHYLCAAKVDLAAPAQIPP